MGAFEVWLDTALGFLQAHILPAVILLAAGILAIRILTKIVSSAMEKTKLDKSLYRLVPAILKPVLYLLLGLAVAAKLGIDVTGVVALASVLTLAVSLTLQTALGNVFGGLTLLYTKPFAPGHYVQIAAREGTVLEVGLAYTKLATVDNKIISIPNASVAAAEIVNYTVSGQRRVDISVRCGWDTPADTVLEALYEAARMDMVLDDPAPTAALTGYEDGLAQYALMVWVKTEDYFPATYTLNRNIQTLFTEKNIAVAAPRIQLQSDNA